MTKGNDPAMPQDFVKGITKREYFAAQAMAGLAATSDQRADEMASRAVEYADALIEALNEDAA
jgi:hypothetical protein